MAALFAALTLAPAAHAVTVQRVVSPAGIEAWLVEDHSVPVLSLSLVFTGGASLDPAGKEGLANMTASLLDEGSGQDDARRFKEKLADLSTTLSFDAGRDGMGGSMRTLSANKDEAFALLAQSLASPRFDAPDVDRIRAAIRTDLARREADPNATAYRAWFAQAFAGHPYGRQADGTPASIGAVTVDDMRGLVRDRLVRDRLVIGVAGDIDAPALAALLDRTFAGLPATGAPGATPETTVSAAGETVVLRRPIPQSIAVFGAPGLKREDPDWQAATLLNYVLGGGSFNSRLMEEVREKRGLAYGVSTALGPLDHAGYMLGRVATQNGRIAESLRVIRAEWQRIGAEGITEAELANAKTYLTGSFPLQLDSTATLAALIVQLQRNHLGIDYLDRRNAEIEAVTLDDVRRVARRLYQADGLITVIVGNPDGVAATRQSEGPG